MYKHTNSNCITVLWWKSAYLKKIDCNHCGVCTSTCTCVEVEMLIFLKNAHCPDFNVWMTKVRPSSRQQYSSALLSVLQLGCNYWTEEVLLESSKNIRKLKSILLIYTFVFYVVWYFSAPPKNVFSLFYSWASKLLYI